MKTLSQTSLVFSACFALALSAQAAMTTVESFESYPTSVELNTAWTTVAGTPVVTLETANVCAGTRAMAVTYAGASAPFTNLVKLTFGSNQNWMTNTVLTFNYGGLTNSSDNIIVQLVDQFGVVLGTRQIIGGTLNPPCSVASVDISNGSAFTNAANGTGLQSVRGIQLGVVASVASHAGTVYFDNIQVGNKGVLSVLGSSVAKGYGSSGAAANQLINGSFLNGYAAILTATEGSNGWWVVNQSVGGDTTGGVINRFYTDEVPVHADQDLIALSLGNEGLPGAANPQAIYNQFFTGITNLIAMSRSNNIVPLLGNQYPRDPYTANEYGYLKRMDLQVNTLNVPSVNFLGATDDGAGHWINNSFINLGSGDGIHPNDAGHYEMFLTIVPSVFDAVKAGKPTPQWGSRSQYLRITGDASQPAPLSLSATLMHSFSVSFQVRALGTGTVASITLPNSPHPTIEITPTGLAYVGTNGVVNNSGVSGTNGAWHNVVVTHAWARGLTWFYVDGVLASTVSERLTPVGFVLGGRGSAATRPASPVQADYQNWFVHRSMMNLEEVTAQQLGNLQQASLELFTPLDDNAFVQGNSATNRAQSLSVASINGASANYLSVPSLAAPTGLNVTSNYTPAMVLNWTDPGAATEDAYYVERSTAGGAWSNLTTLPAHATTYTDTTVGIATNYQYRVSYSLSGLRSDYAISPVISLPSTNSTLFSSGTVLIDFGPNNVLDGNITTSPDLNGNYWNNMTSTANGASITNLVTTNNLSSAIAIMLTSAQWAQNGIRNGGLTNPSPALLGIFAVPTVTQDYFYVNQTFGTANATNTFLISGLNPALSYNLSMFGTRNTAGAAPYTRTTRYSVTDINGIHATNLVTSGTNVNSGTNPGNTSGNDKTIVSLNGLVPNSSGQLTFAMIIGDSANFAYIAALQITSVASAPVFTVQPQSQTDRVGTTNTLTAVAASTLPVSYQWYFANTPVPGATSTNLVLANVGATNAGNYYLVAWNSVGFSTSSVAVVSIAPLHFPGAATLVDFGPNDVVNGTNTLSPDLNGNYWNNMIAVANGSSITNLVTVNNSASSIGVTLISSGWQENGIQNGGLTNPNPALLGDFAVATATEDYFFVNGTQGTSATLQLSGLNPALTYNLSMFGTRNSAVTAPTVRTSNYSVTDANGLHSVNLVTSGPNSNSGSNAGNTGGNDKTIVSLNGLVPNVSGQLNLTLTCADSAGFAYLGALEIMYTETAPAFTLNPQSQTDRVGTTNTLNSFSTGSSPLSYQWYFANAPLSGATNANLLLPNVSSTNAGSYYVVASNSLGLATSSVAVVTIAPLHVPPQAIFIDFGPNDVVNGTNTLSPDANGNYWNNMISVFNVVQGLSITNIVTVNNTPTTVAATVTTPLNSFKSNGIQTGGLTTPDAALLGDFAVASATEDYFFTEGSGASATLELTGLDPTLTYSLSMFATRNTATVRTSNYSVTDANGLHSVNLQTSGAGAGSAASPNGNDDTIVSLTDLVPTPSGLIDLKVTEVNGGFAYLGLLEIVANGSAPAFIVNPQSQTNMVGRMITLNALATNSQPINYQWYFTNAPLPGATGTNLLLASVDFTNAGSYFAVASNVFGSAVSSVAVVTVVPLVAPNFLPPSKIAGGWHLEFSGAPGFNYHIERATSLNGPWIDLGTVVSPANGVCVFDDTNALSDRAFYRSVIP